jgi:quercetin dioxygenase-like cupin family protein
MFHHIRKGDIPPSPRRTVTFVGEPYKAGISMFLVDNEPGEGPDPHTHPYPETFVIRSGRGLFRAGGSEIEAGPGDIVVIEAGTLHGFKNLGPGRLEVVCIHASPLMQSDYPDDTTPA